MRLQHHPKHFFGSDLIDVGTDNAISPWHPEKHPFPMSATDDGIAMYVRLEQALKQLYLSRVT